MNKKSIWKLQIKTEKDFNTSKNMKYKDFLKTSIQCENQN